MAEQPERLRFDDLYEEHFAFAWRNLRRLGVPDNALWDAAQDVFLVVHRRLEEFELRAPRAWVYSIVVRVARQHRRTQRRKRAEPLDDPGQLVDAAAPGPEGLAARNEALHRLMLLLETLDGEKREAFVLSDLEGLSAPEISTVLGVNLNTVYSRIRAARQKVERALESLRHEERE